MRRAAAILVVLLLAAAARADEPAPAKPEEATPSEKPLKPSNGISELDDPSRPYTEGWHGGSPPGEHFSIRGNLWFLSHQSTALELGSNERTLAVRSGTLGTPSQGAAGGLGAELYGGKLGWGSLDWWTTQSHGLATLDRDITLDETSFAQGTLVRSEITQHFLKARDGLDIRFRLPIAKEAWLDFNFGPVMSLMVRYESITVRALSGSQRVSDALLAVSLCPGWRAGVDLHVLDDFTIRIGSDVDLLPHLDHNLLSFTREPSIDAWADARIYFAARIWFLELSGGWRYFRSLASGGHYRQAETDMRGVFAELAVRF